MAAEKKSKMETKYVVYVGMFAALLAILSQIAIPMPSGVPITLQTFAVAVTGVILGYKLGCVSIFVYILLGAVGVPVFTGFMGGIGKLVGPTGGFIWGFIFMILFCGLSTRTKNIVGKAFLCMVGLACCHLLGALQYSFVAGVSYVDSLLLVSVPYLIKDVASVIIALVVGMIVRFQLVRSKVL